MVNQPFLWSTVFDPYVLEKGIFGKDDWKTVWPLSNVENNPGDHFSVGSCARVLGDIGANIRSGFGKGITNPADWRKNHQVPAPFLTFFGGKKTALQSSSIFGSTPSLSMSPIWILSWEKKQSTQVGHLGWPSISVNPSAAINIPTKPWWKGRFFRFGELSDDLLAGSYQLCWCQPGVWADTNCSTPQDFKVYYLGEWWWFQTGLLFLPRDLGKVKHFFDEHIFRI